MRHAAAFGGLQIFLLHTQKTGIGVFQHWEHGVDGQRNDDGHWHHAQPEEQQADKYEPGNRLKNRDDRQHDTGYPGHSGEGNAKQQAQKKSDGHANQDIASMNQDGIPQHGTVCIKESSHFSSPHSVSATARATLVLVTMPATVSSSLRTIT